MAVADMVADMAADIVADTAADIVADTAADIVDYHHCSIFLEMLVLS